MFYDIDKLKGFGIGAVVDGYDAVIISNLAEKAKNDILYIVSDGIKLNRTAQMLQYMNPKLEVLSFPAWDTVPYDRISPNSNIMGARIETLSELALNSESKKPRVIISSVSAVLQRIPPKKIFLNSIREIKVGGRLDFNSFTHYAAINGYMRVEQVMEQGEYAVRGDILDIFPSGSFEPVRIDVFGDEIEKIRTFDPISQRTTGALKKYTFQVMGEVILDENTIKTFRSKYREAFGLNANTDEIYESVSAGQKYLGLENWLPLFYEESKLPTIFDYIPLADVVVGSEVLDAVKTKEDAIIDYYQARLEALKIMKDKEDIYRPVKPEAMYLNSGGFNEILEKKEAVGLTSLSLNEGEKIFNAEVVPVRDFSHAKSQGIGKVYEELKAYLNENKKLKRLICCQSEGSRDKLFSLMSEHGIDNLGFAESWKDGMEKASGKTILIVMSLDTGFKGEGLCIISEQEILGEKQTRKVRRKASEEFIADVSSLNIGDLVVHIEHGIGRFLGLEQIVAGGAPHDCLKILYANDDKLFVPVENIEVLSRYGIENENVHLDVLGGAAWQAKKAKVKNRIRDIAEQLIKIAATRKLRHGEIFIPPSGLYEEFALGFQYQETEDQLNAINDVISDLSSGMPMDRLICGDVGFGKTEVAMRAAFVVAASGAQVAIITPTTLLARQHYYNFKKRFEGFPIKVKMLSRLVTAKESKDVKKGLKDGAVEIVIGTHALLAKDMEFCNLGLLIIDEEQHFGVAHKEKLKALKSDVHVMTLTATPIPRTLQLSLTGVKQLSIIATPPVDRLAARSFVMPFDAVMIKEAIYREKFRNGQVFFVCPRVSDLFQVEEMLSELVPDIKIAVAHGQMSANFLEDVMNDFADKKYDLLLSTTIIESGIDMPTVNTMVIYRSDMFGLAQLYQLKGRVGRSKIRGYCYFTVPQRKKLNPIAWRRLNILKALDNLGAGFALASYDMDIRGSGNILGEEQSGHIKEVGIALYQHMLEEEIARLKAGEIGVLAEGEDWVPQISIGIPIMIPEAYVQDLGVRLGLYKRIGALKEREEILDMKEELIDRFGKMPDEVENLMTIVEIKQLCKNANIEKIDAGAKGAVLTFKDNKFARPEKLVEFISKQFGLIKIRPDQKVFIEKNLESYKVRVDTIKNYINKIVELLNG
ncbi:MAG: transcription-repair coupling factor [Lactobacillaceae bacterium]|jgi:transcription-repair coupling factor (superfamily II helicase)|nr:transcription-repair coupling factor [Lactobacillaceae bacterium]